MNGNRIIAIVGGVVALAFLVAIAFGGSDRTEPATPFGVVEVQGALPEYSQGAVDTAVGMEMPRLTGTDLGGEPLTIAPSGRPQAIVFLAHWCGHCRNEVPAVQEWLDDTGGVDGVDIVAVATGIDPLLANYPPHFWLEDEGWTPPTLWDDEPSTALRAYGGRSFPYWVFVDGDGRVVGRMTGELGAATLEGVLVSLLG